MILLELKSLSISFGGLKAVSELNIKIKKGELYGLIGPNGAGKTTVFNLLTGVYRPTEGQILLEGENLVGKSTIEINKKGVARTFQNIRLFHHMETAHHHIRTSSVFLLVSVKNIQDPIMGASGDQKFLFPAYHQALLMGKLILHPLPLLQHG